MHFVDVSPAVPGMLYELFARVLMAVHKRNASGAAVAIDWPQWSGCHLGSVMRLIGGQGELQALLILIAPLLESDLLILKQGVTAVPVDAKVTHAFIRDQSQTSPSRVRRLARRAELRGEIFNFAEPQESFQNPALPVFSASSQQKFMLRVKRVDFVEGETPSSGRAFGLGFPIPTF